MLSTAVQLRRVFTGPGPARWVALGLLLVLTTAAEATAAGLVFALVDLLATGSTTVPLLGQLALEGRSVTPLATAITAVFLLRVLLVLAQDRLLNAICYGAGAHLEERLMLAFLRLPSREARRRGQAELVRTVHDTVILVVEGALVPLVASAGLALRAVGIGSVMVWVAPLPSALAVVVFGPVLWILTRALRGRTHQLGAEIEFSLTESLKVAVETLNLATELRSAGQAGAFARRFGAVRWRLARAAARDEVLGALPRLVAETVLVLFIVCYLAISVARGDAQSALPTLGLFAYSALRLLPSVVGIVGLVHSVRHTGPALATLVSHLPLLATLPEAGAVRPAAPTTIELRGITVHHDGAPSPTLDALDLELRRGDVIAVTGRNGSGKSTLIDVLSGQVAPVSGEILVDGRPAAVAGDGWLEQVGLVAQHVQLLDADLITNVTLLLHEEEQDPTGARQVLDLVGAGQLERRLPGGPGSALGEDGRLLSGGERQKVALARALHRQVGVLLVDEGTAALDAQSRAAVMAAIASGSQDRITVVVTHDSRLADACTRTLQLTGGRLREQSRAAVTSHG